MRRMMAAEKAAAVARGEEETIDETSEDAEDDEAVDNGSDEPEGPWFNESVIDSYLLW